MPRKTRGKVTLSGERRTDLEGATRLLTVYALPHGSTARPAHSRRLERGHLGQDARRGIEHRQRQHRSRSFAEAKAEVQNRIETQRPERGPWPPSARPGSSPPAASPPIPAPEKFARTASAPATAGPMLRSAVPEPMAQRRTALGQSLAPATPMSTISVRACICRASTLIAAP